MPCFIGKVSTVDIVEAHFIPMPVKSNPSSGILSILSIHDFIQIPEPGSHNRIELTYDTKITNCQFPASITQYLIKTTDKSPHIFRTKIS